MKTLALMAAVFGLSTTAAFADCSYHNTSAAVDVDQTMTTASIETEQSTATDVVLLKKTQRSPDKTEASQ